VTLSLAEGRFDTSHIATCPDVAPAECAVEPIPPHRHVIRLNLYYADLFAAYGLGANSQVSLRVPYDVKDQHVRYATLDGSPFVPPYGDIHHRTETLWGVSDADLLYWKVPALLQGAASGVTIAIGTTLPIGKTVPDPVRLGLEGKKHEHLQFGSGTFDPKLVVSAYQRSGRFLIGEAVEARLPVYESPGGYRPPINLQWGLGPSALLGRWSVSLQYLGQYQTVGKWHGLEDEGTGFVSGGGILRGTYLATPKLTLFAGVYQEIFSHGSSGQTFHQGTTVSFGITRIFP
jgi:hypothetical protein